MRIVKELHGSFSWTHTVILGLYRHWEEQCWQPNPSRLLVGNWWRESLQLTRLSPNLHYRTLSIIITPPSTHRSCQVHCMLMNRISLSTGVQYNGITDSTRIHKPPNSLLPPHQPDPRSLRNRRTVSLPRKGTRAQLMQIGSISVMHHEWSFTIVSNSVWYSVSICKLSRPCPHTRF